MPHHRLLHRDTTLWACTVRLGSKHQCHAKGKSNYLVPYINIFAASGLVDSPSSGSSWEHPCQDMWFPRSCGFRSSWHGSWQEGPPHPWEAIPQHCQCNTLGVKHALSLINSSISILIKHSIAWTCHSSKYDFMCFILCELNMVKILWLLLNSWIAQIRLKFVLEELRVILWNFWSYRNWEIDFIQKFSKWIYLKTYN